MNRRMIKNYKELRPLVEELGFLPLLPGLIPNFSLWEYTNTGAWFQRVMQRRMTSNDPWEWRCLAAGEGHLAYGKFFNGKAGFISKEWFPYFANARRKGKSFDQLFVQENLPLETGRIMELFFGGEEFPTYEIKKRTGITHQFEKTATMLQQLTFLVTSDFFRKKTKDGREYGWSIGVLGLAESLFGTGCVHSQFSASPESSRQKIITHLHQMFPKVTMKKLEQFVD